VVRSAGSSGEGLVGLLTTRGIEDVFHYAPLHYLIFIARSKALLSKNELRRLGFDASHFRRTSRQRDLVRGFSNYVHLSLQSHPPILKAKLRAGFPHLEVRVPAAWVETGTFHLCRYNIAKSRNPKTGKRPAPESPATGCYHGGKHLPTAEKPAEREDLLRRNLGRNMVEALVPERLALPESTQMIFFHESDYRLAMDLIEQLGINWPLLLATDLRYEPNAKYSAVVRQFLNRAAADPEWLGDGLDFDLV
jgi:hypothetical protein